jgi:hypothetical protein
MCINEKSEDKATTRETVVGLHRCLEREMFLVRNRIVNEALVDILGESRHHESITEDVCLDLR